MNKNIVLIGFMGSGKSSVARELARRLKRELVTTDGLIEVREGKKINDIFKTRGESYFRKVERGIIKEVSGRKGVIIDCGGGVVLDPANLSDLKINGIVFYLQARPDVIYERVKHESHRPLLQSPDPLGCINELYQQRLPLYNQADYIIDANGASIEGSVVEILKKIQ